MKSVSSVKTSCSYRLWLHSNLLDFYNASTLSSSKEKKLITSSWKMILFTFLFARIIFPLLYFYSTFLVWICINVICDYKSSACLSWNIWKCNKNCTDSLKIFYNLMVQMEKNCFYFQKNTNKVKVRGLKNIFHAKSDQNIVSVAILRQNRL